MTTAAAEIALTARESFVARHVGPSDTEISQMLAELGLDSLDSLIDSTVPQGIRLRGTLALGPGKSEEDVLGELHALSKRNRVFRSYLGMGYHDCVTPPVILRNVLESPAWYTAYTPYQAEIAQGRLEALLNFQTMVMDLTGLGIANASLLDEGTAAAEAMAMSYGVAGKDGKSVFLVAAECHPQTIDVVRTRAEARGIEVRVSPSAAMSVDASVFGVLVQYPDTYGAVSDYRALASEAHAHGALVTAATDLLALTLITPPGEWGADVAVGNSQRFGVPLGYGGPHAAFFATRDEYKRQMPGRIIGVSRDADGRPALRMALQTREQHIRREKATSNVCTAQVLLAVAASMYAVYHGAEGLKRIASRVHRYATLVAAAVTRFGMRVEHDNYFDTIVVNVGARSSDRVIADAAERGINLRRIDGDRVAVALDETVHDADLTELIELFARGAAPPSLHDLGADADPRYDERFRRATPFLTHPVFNTHRSETAMLRYIFELQNRDLSLVHSMISLGSCTMKLNAAAEMIPVTWPGFGRIHPFAPREQAEGYAALFGELEAALSEITGFPTVSLQPNAGSQGEFAGLLAIRDYHRSRGQGHRDVCLIPQSAHGTNPASAVMAGMKVIVVKTDASGNIDIADLRARADANAESLAALMITYPSTHGVFEETVAEVCAVVHEHGGQVYMDGANMNAMVGLCRPADFGADVCHLNLHKTFCIPHGGGGPGMGPIGVASHLAPFIPGHAVVAPAPGRDSGAVSAAPWGSPSILPISYAYIRLMGGEGLTHATKVAILNANYVARKLAPHYPILYVGANGTVAHECIVDTRVARQAGVDVEDIAKRLMDYGFHAPTVSFPVAGTLMIEPTESESKAELDRFCDAMISIRDEVREIEIGTADARDNVLKNAPHTLERATATAWTHAYTREQAAFPAPWIRGRKFWPAVARVESAYGDRNLICSCPPVDAYAETVAGASE